MSKSKSTPGHFLRYLVVKVFSHRQKHKPGPWLFSHSISDYDQESPCPSILDSTSPALISRGAATWCALNTRPGCPTMSAYTAVITILSHQNKSATRSIKLATKLENVQASNTHPPSSPIKSPSSFTNAAPYPCRSSTTRYTHRTNTSTVATAMKPSGRTAIRRLRAPAEVPAPRQL